MHVGSSRRAAGFRALCSRGGCLCGGPHRHQRCCRHRCQLCGSSCSPPRDRQHGGAVPDLQQPGNCHCPLVHIWPTASQHSLQLPRSCDRQVGLRFLGAMLISVLNLKQIGYCHCPLVNFEPAACQHSSQLSRPHHARLGRASTTVG